MWLGDKHLTKVNWLPMGMSGSEHHLGEKIKKHLALLDLACETNGARVNRRRFVFR
jgi:hypothetical protein